MIIAVDVRGFAGRGRLSRRHKRPTTEKVLREIRILYDSNIVQYVGIQLRTIFLIRTFATEIC